MLVPSEAHSPFRQWRCLTWLVAFALGTVLVLGTLCVLPWWLSLLEGRLSMSLRWLVFLFCLFFPNLWRNANQSSETMSEREPFLSCEVSFFPRDVRDRCVWFSRANSVRFSCPPRSLAVLTPIGYTNSNKVLNWTLTDIIYSDIMSTLYCFLGPQ